MRSVFASASFIVGSLVLVACGSVSAQGFAPGFQKAGERASMSSATVPAGADAAPLMVEIEHGADSFYFMAPHRENARDRSPFSNERVTTVSAGPGALQPFPTDLTVGWRYSARLERAAEFTVTYNAQASFDMGENEVATGRSTSEYLVRLEIARPLGRVTPRAEIGYRVLSASPYEAQRGRSMFGAVGMSYQAGERSSVDLYFDHAGAPVAGLAAQRNLIVNFSRRVSSRADLGIYAFRSLSEDKAYNAGIRLTMQF